MLHCQCCPKGLDGGVSSVHYVDWLFEVGVSGYVDLQLIGEISLLRHPRIGMAAEGAGDRLRQLLLWGVIQMY